MPRMLRRAALVWLTVASSGCYHAHLILNGGPTSASYFTATLSASRVVPPPVTGAGAVAGLPASAACDANGLYDVRVDSTLGYAAGTVFSFGKWSRVQVAWRCAKRDAIVGPALPSSSVTHAPSAASAAPAQPLTKRTVHPLIWGVRQQDLTPPPNPAVKTPSNCESNGMRQMTVHKNYGYALITVVTLGFWSPIEVEWQCVAAKEESHAAR